MAYYQQRTSGRPSTGTHSNVHMNYGRSTSSPKPMLLQTNELLQAEPRKQSMLPSTIGPSDLSEVSGLRKLLHVASELQQIDLDSSLKAYKEFMKQTRQEHISNSEEKILETRREKLEELNSDAFTKGLEKYEESLRALIQENEKLQEEKKSLYVKCRQHQDMLDGLEKENRKQKEDLKSREDELRKVKSEKDAALFDKNEMLSRLSKELGTKLSDNNPTIADLSDPNRAMKLGEKYSELYDNDWTDALDILCGTGFDEEAGIKVLLEVLKKSHQLCVELSEKQMVSLQMTLVNPALPGVPKPAWGDTINPMIAKSTFKHLKECRKEMSTKAVENILKEYGTKQIVDRAERIPDFFKKCLEICWLMCVQDPPVVIGGEATVGVSFDTNMYKPYTNSGTVVSYNVWPPLLLHENGPILTKGIVQPIKEEKKREKMAERGKTTAGMHSRGLSKTLGPSSGKNMMTTLRTHPFGDPTKEETSPPIDDGWKKNPQYHVTAQYYDNQVCEDRKVPQYQMSAYTQQTTSASDSNPAYSRHVYVQQPALPPKRPLYPVTRHHGRDYVLYGQNRYELGEFKRLFNITSNEQFYLTE
ncbi:uncharacterized protein LOC110449488 [Mizuhopecten yessoensis]|uniref:Mitochondria-eating protein n=1 Tax=Mizuhopecten yessoensis TaxID=6573 RepID=A0A210QR73_MIZYE|nr:uncharacterized protein LOC110449488 [Mizuhopecten yessoensis]OWF51198.1 hypothetical protein KP79_PYT12983 [Mizuhopecten yessoensis]